MRPGGKNTRDYRDVDGILILDKASGLSSNQALQRVRKLYAARKAGHCGSLDPLATGVLPICLGEATKFSSYLLGANKTYRADCRLGQVTTTGDAEGDIIDTAPVDVDLERIERELERFLGVIEQVPPMYSALKHQGKRLYQLAREGKQVDRPPRRVEIFDLRLLALEGDIMRIEVSCSTGTYIRSLAEDIGKRLGCGAHITALRRTSVDVFDEEDALSFECLQDLQQLRGMAAIDARLLPVTVALQRFPEIVLDSVDSIAIRQGRRLQPEPGMEPGLYRLSSSLDGFIGLGEVTENNELQAKRLMNTAR